MRLLFQALAGFGHPAAVYIATMFAFGTRVRTVIRMAVIENLITGVLGTALGIGLGWLILNTALLSLFEHDAPDPSPLLTVYPATFGWAVLIGVVVVALTPLLMIRTLLKMDIRSTLRVIE